MLGTSALGSDPKKISPSAGGFLEGYKKMRLQSWRVYIYLTTPSQSAEAAD